jgi:hypothetical protein
MRPCALGRAVEASADRFVVEIVDLAHDERQALLEGKALDGALHERSGLAEPRLGFRSLQIGLAALHRYGLVGDPSAFLRPEMIAAQIGGDREEPGPHVGVRAQGSVGPIGPQERLLGQVFRLRRSRCDPSEVAIDLAMMRAHDRLERLCTHHLWKHRRGSVVKTVGGLST